MTYFSKRLPHVVTRADFATLLTSTYAEAMSVDEEEAHDRLTRALVDPALLEDLYFGLSEALRAVQGPKTSEDALMDKLSKAVGKRRGRVKAIEATPAVSAVLVGFNLQIGMGTEAMRETLAGEKGRAMVEEGLRTLGAYLVKELLK